jgi:glutamate racemase
VLGCTHYPFLKGAISYVMGPSVTLVSSDTETANDVYRQLVSRGLERRAPAAPEHHYEATGQSEDEFLRLAHRLIGREIQRVDLVQTGVIDVRGLAEAAAASASSSEPAASAAPAESAVPTASTPPVSTRTTPEETP